MIDATVGDEVTRETSAQCFITCYKIKQILSQSLI